MAYSQFFDPPNDFHPLQEAGGCYCEYENKVLFLKRHPNKPQGNTWGIPGGKLNAGETPRQGTVREVFEEVGIPIHPDDLEDIGPLYVRSSCDYVFHRFRNRFITLPRIQLGLTEHTEIRWLTISEALTFPLMAGGVDALKDYQRFVGA